MKRVVAALICACVASLAGAAEIVLTISNMKLELVDMTPDDGVDPWISAGIVLGTRPTYVNRDASYAGYPSETQISITPELQAFDLGPNSALRWSLDYRFEATLYQGYGVDERVHGFVGANSNSIGSSHVLWDRPFEAEAFATTFDGMPLPRKRMVITEEGTFFGHVLGLPDEVNPGYVAFSIGAVVADAGLLAEPVVAVPESETWMLMLAGLAVLAGGRRSAKRDGGTWTGPSSSGGVPSGVVPRA